MLIVADFSSFKAGYGVGVPALNTIGALLAERVRRDGARPLVTSLDPDQRMELSAVSLANAVAKTAGLLRDDLDAQPGTRISLALPLHWQASVWWGACAAVEAVIVSPEAGVDIGVSTAGNLAAIADCDEQIAVSLAAFGLPDGADLPPHVIEAAVAARVHPDEFTPFTPPDPQTALMALRDEHLSVADCLDRARTCATTWGVASGGRLLVPDTMWTTSTVDSWLALLAVPLVADAGVVLVAGGSSPALIDQVTSTERITAVMTPAF